MIRRPPRSTLFPYTRSSDLNDALMQALAQNGNGTAAYIDTINEARKVLVEEATSTLIPIAKRSEEHTSELQSRQYLVCRLLLEKKKINSQGGHIMCMNCHQH